jgi:hypothetical protein
MILLKVYQRLHYFLDPQTIPGAVISHIRAVMKLPADLVLDIEVARRSLQKEAIGSWTSFSSQFTRLRREQGLTKLLRENALFLSFSLSQNHLSEVIF